MDNIICSQIDFDYLSRLGQDLMDFKEKLLKY